jgi:mannose-1-phosphate guanylyltransferase
MSEFKSVAIILAGGYGTKFWPRSTESHPKQYLHIHGQGTMIQDTVTRLQRNFKNEDIYVVTYKKFEDLTFKQLPDIPHENIISEPFGKHTAPAVGLAMAHIKEKYNDDDVFCVFPSDHIISNLREFNLSLETGIKTSHGRKGIVTIGIEPTRPETQFGYIQINENQEDLDELFDSGVRYANTFAEKPDKRTAERFIESGDFVWNSGIFIWRKDVLMNSFQKYLPDHYEAMNRISKNLSNNDYEENLKNIYMRMDSISLDYGILEKADNVYCVESSFSWSDLETWDELYRLSMKDAKGNVLEGDVISLDSRKSLVFTSGKLVALYGLEDVIVIDSDDALLICKRGESENVQEIIDYMRRKNINRF